MPDDIMGTYCKHKAVLVLVYEEMPRRCRNGVHRSRSHSGEGYSRKCELLRYSQQLRESARSDASTPLPPNNGQSTDKKKKKHKGHPACLYMLIRGITRSSLNDGKKKTRSRSAGTKTNEVMKSFTVLVLEGGVVGGDGFCSVLEGSANGCGEESLYWKVNSPTLSPSHLQDLPGFTRSVYKKDHALVTPESHVFGPLPDWTNTLAAFLITPAMGSQFVMYFAKMQEKSKSGLPPQDVERFVFVVKGVVSLTNASKKNHELKVDSYAYLPPNFEHLLKADSTATLLVIERRYVPLDGTGTSFVVGSTDTQTLLETPGEIFELRKLVPTDTAYDFNIHIMDFKPGEFLNIKEVHYNQHGLLLLEGRGIYRLGDNWYPVQAGDAIWMAPFVPQWYAALGKTRTRYLIYKDVNRNPLF